MRLRVNPYAYVFMTIIIYIDPASVWFQVRTVSAAAGRGEGI